MVSRGVPDLAGLSPVVAIPDAAQCSKQSAPQEYLGDQD